MYANNSAIDINLVGEGFEGAHITDGGALECHTDDTTCCRGIDNPNGPGRGEWYYPDGTVVPPSSNGTGFYRTRNHMVIRLNRVGVAGPTGVYGCVIPGTGGVTITRNITFSAESKYSSYNQLCILHSAMYAKCQGSSSITIKLKAQLKICCMCIIVLAYLQNKERKIVSSEN